MTLIEHDALALIEEVVDRSSLEHLLELIADLCNDKAEHLRTNWQDVYAARCWERDAAKLLKLAPKLEN
jgi:hypothetical protein